MSMFSLPGTYPAVGLFSIQHIIFAIICIVLIGIFVFLNRKMTSEQFDRRVKYYAAVITCLEAFKIAWCWANGQFEVNNWVPLYFCSLFLFSLWFASTNIKWLKKLGYSYMAMAGIICGLVFIISPSTSFNTYPIFHFQCLYSMIFHSMMVYCGFMVFVTKSIKLEMKSVYKYWLFCIPFIILATIINEIEKSNLMFFRSPNGIPLQFLFSIYNYSHAMYTIVMAIAHLSLGIIVLLLYRLVNYVHEKHQQTDLLLEDEDNRKKEV